MNLFAIDSLNELREDKLGSNWAKPKMKRFALEKKPAERERV